MGGIFLSSRAGYPALILQSPVTLNSGFIAVEKLCGNQEVSIVNNRFQPQDGNPNTKNDRNNKKIYDLEDLSKCT
jgi:predicted secreted protein